MTRHRATAPEQPQSPILECEGIERSFGGLRALKGVSPTIHAREIYGLVGQSLARTFQNLASFRGMSVLDKILLGRHVPMQPSALASLFYWVWAAREEVARRISRRPRFSPRYSPAIASGACSMPSRISSR